VIRTYRCVSDRYDPSGAETYASVAEFLDMCHAVFGEAPDLTEMSPGRWYDDEGPVLIDIDWSEHLSAGDEDSP
jgi:hypothetical protein